MESLFQKFNNFLKGPEISIFHEFRKPPYGGGNQFLLALEKELGNRNYDVGRNRVGKNTKVVLFNSFNFNFDKLLKLKIRFSPKMIHRVDGPIDVYRGETSGIDKRISQMNHALANKTIFQSEYSMKKHSDLNLNFKNPTIIHNAPDSEIFNNKNRIPIPNGERKIKLITTSWSDNQKKGGPLLAWLDEHLDYSKYELTFVGRTKFSFKNTRIIPPVSSIKLSGILKAHDIYIAPSQNDPCSNALIEALSSGLPAVFLNSGGHPELVKGAGVSFSNESELLEAIDKVSSNYENYQAKIEVMNLKEVTDKYLEVFFE